MGGAVKIEEVRISRAEATQSQTSWRSSTAHRWPRVFAPFEPSMESCTMCVGLPFSA